MVPVCNAKLQGVLYHFILNAPEEIITSWKLKKEKGISHLRYFVKSIVL